MNQVGYSEEQCGAWVRLTMDCDTLFGEAEDILDQCSSGTQYSFRRIGFLVLVYIETDAEKVVFECALKGLQLSSTLKLVDVNSGTVVIELPVSAEDMHDIANTLQFAPSVFSSYDHKTKQLTLFSSTDIGIKVMSAVALKYAWN